MGDDNDRWAAKGTEFFLCARQRDHGQDHDAASRVGCGAKNEEPAGRPRQLRMDRWQQVHVAQGGFGRDRTKFPAKTTFTDVGIKKKSFCGSIDNEKLCLHVDFGKFGDSNAIEALIGSRYVTLNNSIQDSSYIKQTLGYRMLDMAGLPNSGDATMPGCSSTEC